MMNISLGDCHNPARGSALGGLLVRAGTCTVIVQLPAASNVRRTVFTSEASFSPSHAAQSSGCRIAGIRSVMREIRALAGVVARMNGSTVSGLFVRFLQITAIAMAYTGGWENVCSSRHEDIWANLPHIRADLTPARKR